MASINRLILISIVLGCCLGLRMHSRFRFRSRRSFSIEHPHLQLSKSQTTTSYQHPNLNRSVFYEEQINITALPVPKSKTLSQNQKKVTESERKTEKQRAHEPVRGDSLNNNISASNPITSSNSLSKTQGSDNTLANAANIATIGASGAQILESLQQDNKVVILNDSATVKAENAATCSEKQKIACIWMPIQQPDQQTSKNIPDFFKKAYESEKCKERLVLLGQDEFKQYVKRWNQRTTQDQRIDPEKYALSEKINMLKLLFLYFESGTFIEKGLQVNQECYQKVDSKGEIVFTLFNRFHNSIKVPIDSFMHVEQKYNDQVYRMLVRQIYGISPWAECEQRQCMILNCHQSKTV